MPRLAKSRVNSCQHASGGAPSGGARSGRLTGQKR